MPTTHSLKLSEPWFGLVMGGIKMVEGCLLDEKRRRIKTGDALLFSDINETFPKRVAGVGHYRSFREMISAETFCPEWQR
jgi:ASC-1-like (ASCH) protein